MLKKAEIAYLLLGSNIGDRVDHLKRATVALERHYPIKALSNIYETASWGDRSQDAYLNQAIALEVAESPEKLHTATRAVEKSMGRLEKGNYQPRIIDIDILFLENRIVQTNFLTIPHPRISIRQFVLVPLCEIAADFTHPVLCRTIRELQYACEDQLAVKKYVP